MGQPLYKKLAGELKQQIVSGDLKPNAQIPSQTELAQRNGVSVVTIQKALAILVDEGLIYRVRKRGSFVTDLTERRGTRIKLPIDTVYFAYSQTPVNVFNQDLHLASIQGMIDVCEDYGLTFRMLNMRDRWELPTEPNAGFILWGFSGHNAVGYPRLGFIDAVERWKTNEIPLVIIHQYFSHFNVPRVNCDNVQGAFLATKHLMSLGHERIGIILSGESELELNPEFVLRLQGYRMALQSEDIPFDADLLCVKGGQDGEDEDSGFEAFKQFMHLRVPPTAVFAGSDVKALGALYAASDMGLRVPDHVSIIGYDGNRFGANVLPALTTIDQDFATLGRQAVEALLRATTGQVAEVLIPPKLILRQSTKARTTVAAVNIHTS